MINITYDPRAAGDVLRYHTWRMNCPQTIGLHTWQVMRIMLTIWPDCPRELLIYAVTHDMGEMAGDIPYPFKKNVPGLKQNMDTAEGLVKHEMKLKVGMPPSVKLSGAHLQFFKLCENIEMWEAGLVEMNMGNKYGALIAQRMEAATHEILWKMGVGADETPITEAAQEYMSRRLKQEEI